MKKKAFRKDGLLAKATAAVLSVTLALCMTPAMALAQPAEAPADDALSAQADELRDGTYSATINAGMSMMTSGGAAATSYVVVSGEEAYLVFPGVDEPNMTDGTSAKENHQGLHLRFAHQQVRAG